MVPTMRGIREYWLGETGTRLTKGYAEIEDETSSEHLW